MKPFSHLKKLINYFFKKILPNKRKNEFINDHSFNLIFEHLIYKYDRKLIEKIMKIYDGDISAVQKYMKRCYYGKFSCKWGFAKKHADSQLTSDYVSKCTNYKELAEYLLEDEIFKFIKVNGHFHVFINDNIAI